MKEISYHKIEKSVISEWKKGLIKKRMEATSQMEIQNNILDPS